MIKSQISFRQHISAVGPPRKKEISLLEINKPSFDFKKHFQKDLIAAFNNWWVCRKIKPWTLDDCMIIDAATPMRYSFSQFEISELEKLFKLANKISEILSHEEEIKKVVIGVNINHKKGNVHLDKILLRLHLHVLGFRAKEMKEMKSVGLDELEERQPGTLKCFFDPKLKEFQRELLPTLENLLSKYAVAAKIEKDKIAVRIKFSRGKKLLLETWFSKFVWAIDRVIDKKFSGLSYSFCLTFSQGKMTLSLAPRSVFGKGILETLGIILTRDETKSIPKNKLRKREDFFEKIKQKIL